MRRNNLVESHHLLLSWISSVLSLTCYYCSTARIKMRFAGPFTVLFLFLSLASGNSTSSEISSGSEVIEKVEEAPPSQTSTSTNDVLLVVAGTEKDNDMYANMAMEELLLFESLINEEKVTEENRESDSKADKDDIQATSATMAESRVSTGDVGVRRRQGEFDPELDQKPSTSGVEFDDSKEGARQNPPPPRFGQRSRASSNPAQEEAPVLQLTEGGYQRPYQNRGRFRNRLASRPDSSEKSENVQVPARSPSEDRQPAPRRVVPQVTYSNQQSRQPAYVSGPLYEPQRTFGPGPMLRPAFQTAAQNVVPVGPNVPTPVQNGLLNAPPPSFLDYTPPAFRAQFPPSNDIGYAGFAGDQSNVPLYQAAQANPFQNAGFLFQSSPQMQPQPIFVDQARNLQPHLQFDPSRNLQRQLPQSAVPVYENFPNAEDSSRANFAPYFTNPNVNSQFQVNPNVNSQFQVPPNFYGANLQGFNNPPVNFMANYPNPEERFAPQLFRYPAVTQEQNVNRQNPNDQQTDSDTSQEDKRAKSESKEDRSASNNDDPTTPPFGTRLQEQNERDFYIRYPTNEAGYAVRENLPSQNGSEETKDSTQRSPADPRSFASRDPYRDALTSVRNERQNRTRSFVPEELFRDVPLDFGYQRPQNQILVEYPDGNRDLPRHLSPNFDPRGPFNSMMPLSDDRYPFLNAVNQRSGNQKPEETIPDCAKQNNASFCFEDSEYPKNDILYSINSNSYIMDRLSGPTDLKRLDSSNIIENRNASNQEIEQYACAVDTKSGSPLRAKNVEGSWRVIVNAGQFLQPLRLEVCRSEGDACSYADSRVTTRCEQKFSLQRLLTWSPDRGLVADIFKIPVACSCRILQAPPA